MHKADKIIIFLYILKNLDRIHQKKSCFNADLLSGEAGIYVID